MPSHLSSKTNLSAIWTCKRRPIYEKDSSRLLQVVQNVTVRSFSSAPKYTIKHEHVSRRDNRADVGHLKPAPSEGLTYLGSQRQARPLRAALGKLDQRKQPRDDTQHSNHRDSKWKNKKENLKQL